MQYHEYRSRREYQRWKRDFKSMFFSGEMRVLEVVKSWWKMRKLRKSRDALLAQPSEKV